MKILAVILMSLLTSGVVSAITPKEADSALPNIQLSSVDVQPSLNRAYELMLQNNPQYALELYRNITETDPACDAAWAGLAWAYSSLSKPGTSYRIMKSQLQKNPAFAAYHIQTGLALLLLQRYPEARERYALAAHHSFDDYILKPIAYHGLADSYTALDDQTLGIRYRRMANSLSGTQMPVAHLEASTSMYYGRTNATKDLWGFNQDLRVNTWKLKAGYEDFRISGKTYRHMMGIGVRKQIYAFELGVSAHRLTSDDTNTYPANQVAAQLQAKLHPGKVFVRPSLSVFFSQYPRFDVQQLSCGTRLQWRDIKADYSISWVYTDSDFPSGDRRFSVHNFSISKPMLWQSTLGMHVNIGEDTWHSAFDGSVIDSYDRSDASLGVSLEFYPLPWCGLYTLYQRGMDDKSNLLYGSMSVYY